MKLKGKILAVALGAVITTSAVVAIKSAAEKADVKNIESNISICGFVPEDYGTISSDKISISDIEKSCFDSQKFTFIKVEDDKIITDKILSAQENNQEIGLIVKPTGENALHTIRTVEAIVDKYDINCPILYDISEYMDKLEYNCLVAEDFLIKLSKKNCYVGLYGSSKDLEKFSEEFKKVISTISLDNYDKLIKVDKKLSDNLDDIDMDEANMYEFKDGIIVWKHDLSKIIEDNNFNNLKEDTTEYIYTVRYGDNLTNIAYAHGITVYDLMKYNSMTDDKIDIGQTIKIPGANAQESDDYSSLDFEITDGTYKESPTETKKIEVSPITNNSDKSRYVGIDVSYAQGDIDWDKVKKEGIDFAIIRFTDFYLDNQDNDEYLDDEELDSYFYQNIKDCEARDIPVGIYYFSRATTKEEAKREAAIIANHLDRLKQKGYTLECPVYLDAETDELNKMMYYRPEEFKELVKESLSIIEKRGYQAGVYANKTNADGILDLSENYSLWLTSNETYENYVTMGEFATPEYQVEFEPNSTISMYQYSQRGDINGINANGVDFDYSNGDIFNKGYTKSVSNIR